MRINYLSRLTRKIAVITGIIGASTVISVPVLAQAESNQAPANQTESPAGAGYEQQAPAAPGAGNTEANLVELASGQENFSTLLQAVQAAGLEETLAGEGPYTVFAPTNEAFAALPEGAVELLLRPENQELLRQVLTYHVVPGRVTSDQITSGPVDTLGGGVAVQVTEDRVIVNDGSVIQPDIQASNGVAHAVNRVLLPRELRETLVSQLEAQQAAQ